MERGQPEYSTEGPRLPLTVASALGPRRGGGVLLRLPLDCRRDTDPPHPLPWSSPAKVPDTLPSDEAR